MNYQTRSDFISYARSVAVPILNTDPIKWPIGSGRAGAKCFTELSDSIVDEVYKTSILPGGISTVGSMFRNPTRIWRMSHHLLRSMKQSNVPLSKRQHTMTTLFEIVASIKYGSVFNDDGYNIIMSPAQIDNNLNRYPLSAISKIEDSKIVHTLSGILWAYAESLYFVAHEVSVELHGLYRNVDKNILIRDYINLSPKDLWPEQKLLPYDNIRIVTNYHNSLDLDFDIYNNHYLRAGNFVRDARDYVIIKDGEVVERNEDIKHLIDQISVATEKIIKLVNGLSEKEIAKKYVEIFWFRKKPFCDLLNMTWMPPDKISQRIEEEGIPPEKPIGAVVPEKIYDLLNCL